jgi:hypothetical protein
MTKPVKRVLNWPLTVDDCLFKVIIRV